MSGANGLEAPPPKLNGRKVRMSKTKTEDKTDVRLGDYVLATKYNDGDAQDHWCVGFYAGLTNPKYDPPRYDVVDNEGKNFRGNGFRRIEKITFERGAWMLKHAKEIELSGISVRRYRKLQEIVGGNGE